MRGPARSGWWLGLFAGLAATAPVAAKEIHAWRTYTNPRFGFSVCWPSDLVQPEPASSNDRGTSFAAADGGHIAVYATSDNRNRPLPEVAREDEHRLSGRDGTITRHILRRDFYVITGYVRDAFFFNRTELKDGVYTSVEITYPARNKALWDEVIEAMSDCLVPG